MAAILKYKGYIGELEIDMDARLLVGEVVNVKDLLAFEGKTVEEASKSFEDAVDDYLAYCAVEGIEPEKPFSGNIPFRTTPETHRNIYIAARLLDKSMNNWMNEVLAEAARKIISTSPEHLMPMLEEVQRKNNQDEESIVAEAQAGHNLEPSDTQQDRFHQDYASERLEGRGRIIALSGPSGEDKKDITNLLKGRLEPVYVSHAISTRKPFQWQKDYGYPYSYVDEEQFKTLIREGKLLNYTYSPYRDSWYGESHDTIMSQLAAGKKVLMEVRIDNAKMLRDKIPDAIILLLMPKSSKEGSPEEAEYQQYIHGNPENHWHDLIIEYTDIHDAEKQILEYVASKERE